jgi:hypothetical protein
MILMSIGYQLGAIAEREGMAKTRGRELEPTPDPEGKARVSLITLKGDPAWLEWLQEYADFLGVPNTTALDIAVREQAKRDGFGKPMPKRLPK